MKAGVKIQASGSDIKVANNSSPLLADWDNDGDLDLLVGQRGPSEYSSDIKIFINEGSKESYNFEASGSVSVGGNTYLKQFFRGQLDYIDLDGDGLKDLIVANANAGSTNGNVGFLKNRGSVSSPAFSNWLNLQADGSDISMAVQQTVASKKDARARVVDWDGDGHLDLLVACDNIFFYKGTGGPVDLVYMANSIQNKISVYQDHGTLKFSMPKNNFKNAYAELLLLNGRAINKTNCISSNEITLGYFNNISAGNYLLRIRSLNNMAIRKIIIK